LRCHGRLLISGFFLYSQFGKPGTKYDFEGHDFADLKQKCAEQAQLQEGMKKKVNNKVMNMIDTYVPTWYSLPFRR
jgi:hypothetical protein